MSNANKLPYYEGKRLSVTDNNGTNCSKNSQYGISDDISCIYSRDDSSIVVDVRVVDNTNSNNIYRYKFTEAIITEIHNFAKIHQFDARNNFKEAWNNWVIENKLIVTHETQRLKDLGYEGDVVDKMFKSARYYFRKKGTKKKEPVKRRNYVGIQKELLESMDVHIINNIKNPDYKPSNGFDNFCKENLDLLKNEINNLISYNITDLKEIKNKIKKTYKNRYFMAINK